jgi:hypothetical protein
MPTSSQVRRFLLRPAAACWWNEPWRGVDVRPDGQRLSASASGGSVSLLGLWHYQSSIGSVRRSNREQRSPCRFRSMRSDRLDCRSPDADEPADATAMVSDDRRMMICACKREGAEEREPTG